MSEAIQQVKNGSSTELPSLLLRLRAEPGFGDSIYALIRELFSSDVAKARELASHWKLLASHPNRDVSSLRVRSLHERLNGNWKQSAQCLNQAGKLAGDPLEAVLIQIPMIDALGRAGHARKAERLALEWEPVLKRASEWHSLARLQINIGNAYLWDDLYPQALKWQRKAVETLAQIDAPFELASAHLGLSTSCLYLGKLSDSRDAAAAAAKSFRSLGHETYGNYADLNIVQCDLFAGNAFSAMTFLIEIRNRPDLDAETQSRIEEFLGDAYLKLNLWQESLDAFRKAASLHTDATHNSNRGNVEFGMAVALQSLGRFSQAEAARKRAKAFYGAIHTWNAVVTLEEAKIALLAGDRARARRIAAAANQRLAALKARRFASEAEFVECEASDPSMILQDRVHLAIRKAKRAGALDLLWKGELLAAKCEGGTARLKRYRRMFDLMMAARLQDQSVHSRASYFEDKSDAISSYVLELCGTGSKADFRRAIQVLGQVRSAALIDEILSGQSSSLPSDAVEQLSALRSEVQQWVQDQPTWLPDRSLALPEVDLSSIQRRWLEGSRSLLQTMERPVPSNSSGAVLMSDGEKLYALAGDHIISFLKSRSDLRKELQWLYFDLAAPMLGNQEWDTCLDEKIKNLREWLWKPLQDSGVQSLAPDGIFWKVPWALLAGYDQGTELSVSPLIAAKGSVLQPVSCQKAAILYHPAASLPHIEREAEDFLVNFPQATIIRSILEAKEFLRSGGEVDLLHVATHAHYHRSNPMFSSIQLEGGMLSAFEIAQSNVRFGHVTLAACDTGALGERRSELDGLVRSAMARGAKTVVASQWALNDEASAVFCREFYRMIKKGESLLDSMKAGRDAVRNRKSHPYFWGGLTSFEGYGD